MSEREKTKRGKKSGSGPAQGDEAPASAVATLEAKPDADAPGTETRDASESLAEGASTAASVTPALAAKLMPAIEAIVLSAERAAPAARIAEALGLIAAPEGEAESDDDAGPEATKLIEDVIVALNEQYAATGRAFRIERVQGGYRVMTLSAHADAVAAFHRSRSAARLSKAGIETLAIIAYKQPITRAQLEAIRGVACGEVLKSLMDRRLITIKGRAEELGRPILYGTSKGFLEHFGLASITDLPSVAELRAGQG